jgi:hypothetical protein
MSTDSCIGLIAMPICTTPAQIKMMLETLLKGLVFPLAINVCLNPIHTLHCVLQDLNHVGKYLHFPWAWHFVISVQNILPSH